MRALYSVSIVVILCLVASIYYVDTDDKANFIALIFSFGATGATIREHVNTSGKAKGMKSTTGATIFAPVMGALLALVLCLLFLSGLVAGDLFPKFLHTDKTFETARAVLHGGVTLASNSDFYKTIIWSTIAGYSQRFVLDKLEGLTKSSKQQTGSVDNQS